MKTIAEIKEILTPFKSEFESFLRDEAKAEYFGELLVDVVKAFREDSSYSIVFEITENGEKARLFRVDGSYDSWQETEFYDGLLDPFYEVEAKKVVVTEYHAV